MVPFVNTCTTVPVLGSTSAVASRTSTPVILWISCRERLAGAGEQLPVKILHLSGACRSFGQGLLGRRQSAMQRYH